MPKTSPNTRPRNPYRASRNPTSRGRNPTNVLNQNDPNYVPEYDDGVPQGPRQRAKYNRMMKQRSAIAPEPDDVKRKRAAQRFLSRKNATAGRAGTVLTSSSKLG